MLVLDGLEMGIGQGADFGERIFQHAYPGLQIAAFSFLVDLLQNLLLRLDPLIKRLADRLHDLLLGLEQEFEKLRTQMALNRWKYLGANGLLGLLKFLPFTDAAENGAKHARQNGGHDLQDGIGD